MHNTVCPPEIFLSIANTSPYSPFLLRDKTFLSDIDKFPGYNKFISCCFMAASLTNISLFEHYIFLKIIQNVSSRSVDAGFITQNYTFYIN